MGVLMQLARALPQLAVQLERSTPPGLPPCTCDSDADVEDDSAAIVCC